MPRGEPAAGWSRSGHKSRRRGGPCGSWRWREAVSPRTRQHTRKGRCAADECRHAVIDCEPVAARDELEVGEALDIGHERGRTARPLELSQRVRDECGASRPQLGEMELAPVACLEQAACSLLCPCEQPGVRVREDPVGRVFGFVQWDAPSVSLEQVDTLDRDAARRGQCGHEQQRRQPPVPDDPRKREHLFPEMTAERAVPAQDDECIGSARERGPSRIRRSLERRVCRQRAHVGDEVDGGAADECFTHSAGVPSEKHADACERLNTRRVVVEDDHVTIVSAAGHESYSHTRWS